MIIWLNCVLTGLPNDHYFPYDTLEAKVALPERWKPSSSTPGTPPSRASAQSKKSTPAESHLIVPHTSNSTDLLTKIDLKTALQYGQALGYPALHEFIREFTTTHLHPTIPYKGGADVILTCGSTDGFSKTIQCFNNEWSEGHDPIEEKEGLLVEEFAYMNAVQTARPRGMNIVPVRLDDDGMVPFGPGGLEDILANWDPSRGKRPHLMYTVT
jgi:DNA-binding transcriptional MocR family regulator